MYPTSRTHTAQLTSWMHPTPCASRDVNVFNGGRLARGALAYGPSARGSGGDGVSEGGERQLDGNGDGGGRERGGGGGGGGGGGDSDGGGNGGTLGDGGGGDGNGWQWFRELPSWLLPAVLFAASSTAYLISRLRADIAVQESHEAAGKEVLVLKYGQHVQNFFYQFLRMGLGFPQVCLGFPQFRAAEQKQILEFRLLFGVKVGLKPT